MAKFARIDFGEFRAPQRTPQGFLRADAYVTRAGILIYRNADGTERRELRPPEEVFKAESLNTLAGVPVTDDHPNVHDPAVTLLNAQNTRQYARGYTGDSIERDGEFVKATVTITDHDLIQRAEGNKSRQISCGYVCDMDFTPGVYNGERYDCIQRNIIYNHAAVLSRGRAGSNVELKLDSAGNAIFDTETHDGVKQMDLVSVKFGKFMIKVPADQVALFETAVKNDSDQIQSLEQTRADLASQLEKVNAEIERLKGQNETLKTQVDSQKAELDSKSGEKLDSLVNEKVKARIQLLGVAQKALDTAKVNLDSMSDLEIKKAIVAAKQPTMRERLDSASDIFVDGAFQAVCGIIGQSGINSAKDAIGQTKTDSAGSGDVVRDARQRMRETSRNAWKTGSSAN